MPTSAKCIQLGLLASLLTRFHRPPCSRTTCLVDIAWLGNIAGQGASPCLGIHMVRLAINEMAAVKVRCHGCMWLENICVLDSFNSSSSIRIQQNCGRFSGCFAIALHLQHNTTFAANAAVGLMSAGLLMLQKQMEALELKNKILESAYSEVHARCTEFEDNFGRHAQLKHILAHGSAPNPSLPPPMQSRRESTPGWHDKMQLLELRRHWRLFLDAA